MLIGVSGKIGAGKDTLAQCIQEIDRDFEIKKFADKLKHIAVLLTGMQDQWTREGKDFYSVEWGMTMRELQQRLGTEGIRQGVHPNGWVLALFADYKPRPVYDLLGGAAGTRPRWIITDMRFPNEAEAIKERGGFLVRINGSRAPDTTGNQNHISETSLDNYDKFDYTFDNSQLTLNELMDHAFAIYALASNKKDGI